MAIIPRIAIQNFMDETGINLDYVGLILELEPEFLDDYIAKRVKRFPEDAKYRLQRLGYSVEDVVGDKMSPLRHAYLKVMAEFLSTEELERRFGLTKEVRQRVIEGANEFPEVPDELKQLAVHCAMRISPDGMKGRYIDAVQCSQKAKAKADDKLMRSLVDQIVEQQSAEVKSKISIELDRSKAREADLRKQLEQLEEENRKLYADNQRLRQENYDIAKKQVVTTTEATDEDKATIFALQQKIETLASNLVVKNTNNHVDCSQFYDGELDLILTEVLTEYINNNPERDRRKDLLQEFLQQFVKTDVKKNQAMLNDVRKQLKDLSAWNDPSRVTTLGKISLIPVSSNKHVKLCVNGDGRYNVVAGISPSDNCASDNAVGYFMKHFT